MRIPDLRIKGLTWLIGMLSLVVLVSAIGITRLNAQVAETIQACKHNRTGVVRIADSCGDETNWTSVKWNNQGPKGEQGEPGSSESPDNNWSRSTTGKMYATNLGDNVGIGTSDPLRDLQVDGRIGINIDGNSDKAVASIGIGLPISLDSTDILDAGQDSRGAGLRFRHDGAGNVWLSMTTRDLTDDVPREVRIAERLTVHYNAATASGNVGIGTISPQSALQVNGYVQLALTPGAPPAADCDDAVKYGRMKVDAMATVSLLYICTADGWVSK